MEVEAIILLVVPYKDNDAIVTALTRTGIVVFSARGIMQLKSKNASVIMLYNHVLLQLNDIDDGKSRFLKSGEVIINASRLFETIDGMLTLSFIGELAYKCVDDESADLIFNLFLDAYKTMSETKNFSIVRLVFLASIIKKLGIGLQLDECVMCGATKNIVSVSYDKGGYICKKCYSMSDINQSGDYLKLTRYVFRALMTEAGRYRVSNEVEARLLLDLVNHLYNELSISIKSYKLISQSIN